MQIQVPFHGLKCAQPVAAGVVIALLAGAGGVRDASAQEAYQPHGEMVTKTPEKDWRGVHGLPDVYCVEFPAPQTVRRLSYGFYSRGAVFLSGVDYPNRLTVNIVTSSIPAGRTVEDEVGRLLANEKRNAQISNLVFDVTEMQTQFGPSVGLSVRNIVDSDATRPYPLVKSFFKPADGKVHSLGVHRLFVRGPDRFEVTVLQQLDRPVNFGAEAEVKKKAMAMLDAVVASLQSCTAKMPIRTPGNAPDLTDRVIDDVFPRQNSKLICSPPGASRDSVRALLDTRLSGVDTKDSSAVNAIATAIYTLFPCPFSPYRPELRPAKAEDLRGDWLFPKESQKLRYGPKSPLWQATPGVPPINCEGVSYFENGRQLVAQVGGTAGRCLTAADMKLYASMPRVENWALIGDGRIRVTRTDVENHIEEWEVFIVEKSFEVDGVRIEANDLVAYRRRDKGNDFNAASMFRHLQRMH